MRIIIAGGSGLIGSYLKKAFEEAGSMVEIISRQSGFIPWEHDQLVAHLENSDVLINLSGHTINCRHNASNQALILNSRIDGTKMLGKALKQCKQPPTLWINASASAIYSHTEETQHSENSKDFANDFLAKVVETWEKTFFVNCNSPFPVSNAVLMSAFRKSVNMKIGIPAPKFLVKIAAIFIGTEPSLILDSTNVYPEKLIKAGFEFKFDCIDKAILNLVKSD